MGAVLAGLAVVAAVALVEWIRTPDAEGAEDADRPDLRREALVGCYDLDLRPWTVSPAEGASRGEASSRGDDAASGADGGRELPAPVAPPERLMLLGDSVDAWGRDLPTFRAVPLEPGADGGLGETEDRPLRWMVRADTLWLLWRAEAFHGGAALFAEGDSLVGTARATSPTVDATADAVAWPLNCSTLEREAAGGLRR